jgi:hypothetical protein
MMFVEIWRNASIIALLGMLVALGTALTAIYCAIRPDERRLALMRPLSLATIFAALATTTIGFANVLTGIGATGNLTTVSWNAVALGTAEALVPLIVAFGTLTVAWLVLAVSLRRG